MATDFILAPNARWQGRNQTGQPIEHGKLYTYINQTTTPKATYQDYLGQQPNTNPVILDGKGEANIYWAVDDLYTIKLFTEDDEEVYTQDNYPVVGTNTTRVVQESAVNIVRNEQFFFWYFGTSFSPVAGTGSQSNTDFICDDWLYKRVSTTYTVNITRQTFAIDQTEVPNNPTYFLRYEATTTPTGETNNRLEQHYVNVQTLAGQAVTISMYLKSPISSVINVYLVQYFGTGGSPSTNVETLVFQENLTTDWQRYSGTIVIPDLVGKSVGSDGNSALILRINFPNDVVATIDLCDLQFQSGSTLSAFPFESLDSQFKELNDRMEYGLFTTGDVKATFRNTPPSGWLLCNDTTIGNVGSGSTTVGFSVKALYTLLWNNVTNVYAPIYDSSGNLTTRGANAEADFNALKRLLLTRTIGRVIASAGTGALLQQVTNVNTGTDTLTIGFTTDLIYNATPVTFTSSGTLPAPLIAATTYYSRQTAATTFQVYANVADAINGVNVIDLTTAGTGTIMVSVNYSAYTLGQPVGEALHGEIIAEMPAHTHPPLAGSAFRVRVPGTGTVDATAGTLNDDNATTGSTGGSTRQNIMQPTVFLNYMIRL